VQSYTGQPVAEIHTLGSPPLLDLVLHSLCAAGARLAGPGEFTLRAFLAGRIDLGQAEAVLGVIDAADPRELSIALGQLAGGLARPLHRLRETLLDLLAHLEAGFDFADEDLPFITRDDLQRGLAEAEGQLAAVEAQMASRGESAGMARAVLTGEPNTGKSSLFNALAGTPAALVSDRPGTTRDYLTADLDLDGVRCRLIDTAGASTAPPLAASPACKIDSAARSAAAAQCHAADVRVLCLDSTHPPSAGESDQLRDEMDRKRIVVLTKCDLPPAADSPRAEKGTVPICAQHPPGRFGKWGLSPFPPPAVRTSSVTGEGLDALRAQLRQSALGGGGGRSEVLAATAARCRDSLRLAGESLGRARRVAAAAQDELAAAEIRVALDELGKITGAVYTDDVLDRIFSRFCVGK
jgi:tRNA modification GTPase